jgi:hypothetical protein
MRESILRGSIAISPSDEEEGKQITLIAGPNDVSHIPVSADVVEFVVAKLSMTNEELSASNIAEREEAEKEAKRQALGAALSANGDVQPEMLRK